MIRKCQNTFILETGHTTYCFGVMPTGQLEHLHYGARLHLDADTIDVLREKKVFAPGNTNLYDAAYAGISLEDVRLEMSSYGKGDIREPFVEIVHADGSYTSDFLYEAYEITNEKTPYETLPGSYDESGEAEQLCVRLRDNNYGLVLELHYYVYAACDVIARSAKLINESSEAVTIKRLMSTQVDFDAADYTFTTFNGAWAREMRRTDVRVCAGKCVNASYAGVSSSRANPFVMLSERGVTEDTGNCYGFNLIYSGNHYEAVEVNSFGKTRFVSGINPQSFSWQLAPGARFEAPEAVMAYSAAGFNGMSQCMHKFVRKHIVRGKWKNKIRPVLLNSWEASYFNIDEQSLLSLAKAGKEVGIELFVMDDGWFGERNDDKHSLGDWEVNTKKLPGGIRGICNKVKELGLDFGIWVEPEMVNEQSRLYRQHPEWVMDIPGKPHSEGRNQRILDLTRSDVQEFIITKMSEVFQSADISYVKWDMNRTFTDYYSRKLPPEQQGEAAHRYVLGLYHCMKVLTERFPEILFEGCSAGGNRFDLGILCYFPQIWASDDTDALCRAEIQNGYSYGYPMSVIGAHVSSCPNHQTLRMTPLETRFQVAAFGVCGYECNLCEMGKTGTDAIREQISLYKKWRDVLQWGSFYRGKSFADGADGAESVLSNLAGNEMEWTCVSADKTKAVGFLMQKLVVPNTFAHIYKAKGLEAEYRYHFYNRRLKSAESDGEIEDNQVYGDTLMYSGVRLRQASGGTGHNNETRFYPDFGSRLYFMEKME